MTETITETIGACSCLAIHLVTAIQRQMQKFILTLCLSLCSYSLLATNVTPTEQPSVFAYPVANSQTHAGLAAIKQNHSQHAGLRSQFVQTRHLAGIPKPLAGSGQMTFKQNHGLWWVMQTPFARQMLISPQGIAARRSADQAFTPMPGSQAHAAEAARLLFALFNADMQQLATQFTIYYVQTAGTWQIGLRPLQASALAPKEIILSGRQAGLLDTVQLTSASLDQTIITLTTQPLTAHDFTLDEQTVFQP